MRNRRLALLVAASGLFAAGTAHAQAYTITDLGMSGGYGINDDGVVVGSGSNLHATIWENGVRFDLGTFGGNQSFADKINASGQIVGAADNASGNRRAFVYTNGNKVDLGTLGGSSSDARGINDLGHAVGASWTANDAQWRAWVYTGGAIQMLPSFGGTYSGAEGINSSGVIAGWSDYSTTSSRRAFRYANGVLTDLGTLSGASVATDINEAGWIVGYAENANGRNRPVRWIGNTLTELAAPQGVRSAYANAVNDSGMVVGTADDRAMIFNNWGPVYLDDLVGPTNLDLQRAEDVNANGDITGLAWNTTTNSYTAFLAERNPLVLAPPSPGLAGVVNTFDVTGAQPGATVYLVYGLQRGTTDLQQWCVGEALGMRNGTIGAQAVANGNGVAVPSGLTPANGSGHTVYYQAVELRSCRVSNLVTYTYP